MRGMLGMKMLRSGLQCQGQGNQPCQFSQDCLGFITDSPVSQECPSPGQSGEPTWDTQQTDSPSSCPSGSTSVSVLCPCFPRLLPAIIPTIGVKYRPIPGRCGIYFSYDFGSRIPLWPGQKCCYNCAAVLDSLYPILFVSLYLHFFHSSQLPLSIIFYGHLTYYHKFCGLKPHIFIVQFRRSEV